MSAEKSQRKTGHESGGTSSVRAELLDSFKTGKDYRHAFVEEKVRSHIAAQIRALREERGLTQPELAAMMDKTQSWVSRLEDANQPPPTIMSLLQVAEAFDVDFEISFSPFSKLLDRLSTMTPDSLKVPGFENDRGLAAEPMKAPHSESIPAPNARDSADSINRIVVDIGARKRKR
jgi:transcriptional regulator with XRE-family HTH domain